MADELTISSGTDGLRATIAADGAELIGLDASDGTPLLWNGGPAWPRHAPVLFPIVGRLAGDTLHHEGQDYRLTQHGFARDRRFEWLEREPARAVLRLRDDAQTRAMYPFAFVLDVAYEVSGTALAVTMTVRNPADTVLPASLGAHPALRWPLADGVAKTDHRLVFAEPEPQSIRRVAGGLITPMPEPGPLDGAILPLDEALFDADAVILPNPASTSLRFEGGSRVLEFSWTNADTLGLWSKRGGDFLCIEPWRGHASPQGFDGAFRDKPGVVAIPPGGTLELGWRVALVTP